MKKVCVIGHFGFGNELLNGQTIKTKIITDELERQLGNNQVIKIDTHGGVKSFLKLPVQIFSALKKCDNIIIFPAQNGLKIITPILFWENKLFRRQLHYSVIGGWLQSFVENRKILKRMLQHFDFIYVETSTMKIALEEQDFRNVVIMPNCKKLRILDESELVYSTSEPYKLCTFSRVMKEKGIEDAINAVKAINEKTGRIVYELDIYGQVDSEQIEWFEALKSNLPKYIQYKGFVPFDKTVDVVKNYYLLLFPTRFYTEGIPGTIIDAYAAGVPVVASKWESFSDIVNTKCGIGYSWDSNKDLIYVLNALSKNTDKVARLKKGALKETSKFIPSNATKVLISNL